MVSWKHYQLTGMRSERRHFRKLHRHLRNHINGKRPGNCISPNPRTTKYLHDKVPVPWRELCTTKYLSLGAHDKVPVPWRQYQRIGDDLRLTGAVEYPQP